jgi:hypothetical protein
MFSEQPYEEYRLIPGRMLMVQLPNSSELRCLHGRAHVIPAPALLGDVLHAPQYALAQNQIYSTPRAHWVQLEAAGSTECRIARFDAAVETPKANRLVAQAARRFESILAGLVARIRRAPRAAS